MLARLARLAPLAWLVPCALALFAYRSLGDFSFAADARMLILDNPWLHDPHGAWAQVTHDYFWSASGNIIPYWRPLTKLSWWAEWQAFGPSAGSFLAVGLAWFVAGTAGLYRLARDLGAGRAAAVGVAALYALHPVAVEPVALLMARSDVVAAAGTVWAVTAWRRWRAGGPAARAWLALHLVALVVALASKEVAVVVPAVLAAWTLLDPERPSTLRRRLTGLAPSVVLAVAYLAVRRAVLAAEHPDLPAAHLDVRPLRLVASLGAYLANTWPLSLASGVRNLPIAEAASAGHLARSVVVLAVTLVVAAYAWRKDRPALALLAWALGALAPVVLTADISVPSGPEELPLADRWLFHALAPALLVWWRLFDRAAVTLPARRAAAALVALACGWLLARSTPDRARFRDELAMLDDEDHAVLHVIPPEYVTAHDRCRFEERQVARAELRGDTSTALAAAEHAASVCGRTAERVADLLDAHLRAGRTEHLAALADEALALPPRDRRGNARVALDAGLAYLSAGRTSEAERWLARSVELGSAPCALPWVPLAELARARADEGEAATRLEHAYVCGGRSDASLLLAAATWLSERGADPRRAQALLTQAARHDLTPDQADQAERVRRALTTPRPRP